VQAQAGAFNYLLLGPHNHTCSARSHSTHPPVRQEARGHGLHQSVWSFRFKLFCIWHRPSFHAPQAHSTPTHLSDRNPLLCPPPGHPAPGQAEKVYLSPHTPPLRACPPVRQEARGRAPHQPPQFQAGHRDRRLRCVRRALQE